MAKTVPVKKETRHTWATRLPLSLIEEMKTINEERGMVLERCAEDLLKRGIRDWREREAGKEGGHNGIVR